MYLTLEELERKLYIENHPLHAVFVEKLDELEEEKELYSQSELDYEYGRGYDDGIADGYKQGRDEGYDEGYEDATKGSA